MNPIHQTSIKNETIDESRAKNLFALVLITSLFFFWGFVHNLDPVLIPHLKRAFSLSDLETALIDFSVFIAYFIMALPAGFLMKKYGYKFGIIFGLVLFAIGSFLFIPAADTGVYFFFLTALFVLACGLTFLETAANPYVVALGDPGSATQRLNFAQSFNGLAAFLAPVIGGKFILSESSLSDQEIFSMLPLEKEQFLMNEAGTVKGPYAILGCLILIIAALFIFIKLPDIKDTQVKDEKTSILKAFMHRHLRFAIIAQFFYVGAQVCVLSFFIRFATSSAGLTSSSASWYAGGAGLAFMIGRFVGTFFMRFTAPNILLFIYALFSMLLTLVAIFSHGIITVYALIGVSFFMSIMFPTIFSLGIAGIGKDTKIGSSLIVMSIVGGAILPLFLGYISDQTASIQYGFLVPFFCFFVVFLFGLKFWKPRVN
ncbi:L-fucose:H+ symporter permease [Pedobacter sp. MC2016-05]|uniref:L-fucose:H+ symporter permease n=1 Tax=Pedobacter sp. MC2016-05 TaxID=2994474 RepID=UPI002246F476|nr:L-fucose:H+ symporter permease [Pedobacter sp. MC2016-05]MCX2473503.1 L-fucose:H+ symporter permease [Pedobacter sp. MC2016-05]